MAATITKLNCVNNNDCVNAGDCIVVYEDHIHNFR